MPETAERGTLRSTLRAQLPTAIPGAVLVLAGVFLTPGHLAPGAAPVPGPSGITFMNVRLAQILLLLAGSWLLLLRPWSPAAPDRSGEARTPWIRIGVLGILFVAVGLYLRYGIIDDAYISLRYARNFAGGNGLVFNPGERVEGYSSFLWVCLLGLYHRLTGGDLVRACVVGGVLAGICLMILTWFLLPKQLRRRSSRPASPSLLLFLAFSIPLAFWSFSGMETGLSAALLVLATLALFRAWRARTAEKARLPGGRLLRTGFFLPGLLFGLAALARPEAWLHALIAVVFVTVSSPRGERLKAGAALGLGFVVPAGGHLLFRLAYYGDLLPNTYYVKVGGFSWSLVRYGFRYLLRGIVWCLPLIALGLLGLLRPRPEDTPGERRERRFALAMILGQMAAILYTGADHFREMRFFVPMLPYLVLFASRGIEAAGTKPGQQPARSGTWIQEGILLGGVVLTLLSAFFYGRVGYDSSLTYGPAITRRWAVIGEWLRAAAAPSDLLATPVAGAMPYVSALPTLDMLGLTDRTIAHKKAALGGRYKDHEKFDTEYMLSRNPDWIFLGHFQVRDLADYLRRPALPVGTDLAKRLPLPGYELVSGQYRGVGFTFLRKTRQNGSR